MDALLIRRRTLKGKLTRLSNLILKEIDSEIDIQQLEIQADNLMLISNDNDILLDEMAQLCGDEEYIPIEIEYNQICDKIDELKLQIKKLQNKTIAFGQSGDSQTKANSNVKLPTIDLPTFSGSYQNWVSFHDLFVSAIHNNNTLSGAQKLQYLKSSLKGDAAVLLQAIKTTDSNYEIAWDVLNNRYQNEMELIYCHLDRLFTQPTMQHESAIEISKLLDTSSECLSTLGNLNQPVNHWDTLLVYFLRKKIDTESLREWELSRSKDAIPTFAQFKEFLEKRARALEFIGHTNGKQQHHSCEKIESFKSKTSRFGSVEPCLICRANDHTIYKCEEFLKSSNLERRNAVAKFKLCFNCLRKGHRADSCKSRRCRSCEAKHHTLLHNEVNDPTNVAATPILGHCAQSKNCVHQVVLPTAIVNVVDFQHQLQPCRLLIDSGSQCNFISEDCAQRLHLPRSRSTVTISAISSKDIGQPQGKVRLQITSRYKPEESIQVDALILKKLTCDLLQRVVDPKVVKTLKNLKLADPTFGKPGRIDILLGAEFFSKVLLVGHFTLEDGSTCALETIFGYVISGSTKVASKFQEIVVTNHVSCDTDTLLQQLWELETIPDIKPLTREEKSSEDHFVNTHNRDSTGRYIVRLPLRGPSGELGNSASRALRTFTNNERRFEGNPLRQGQYQEFMRDYLELGHMEQVLAKEPRPPIKECYYLPHHAIEKKDEPSKFRVVFDASAKTSSNVSLNDKLMVGPVIQEPLINLLMRFRINLVAFTADITKMYRQILIHKEDTDFQRIFWREKAKLPMSEFRLLTVTYGTSAAPFLATRCLQQLADDEEQNYPAGAKVLKSDFYMDDLMSGAETVEEALILQRELMALLNAGGFQLRKWSSNNNTVLENVSPEIREVNLPLEINKDESVKTLGLRWHPASGTFSFKVQNQIECHSVTKRVILSGVARLFDPFCWLSPITLIGKMLLQELWKVKADWDDSVPASIRARWDQLTAEIPLIASIKVDRCLTIVGQDPEYQLHGFSDASEKAYGAVVYLRRTTSSGDVDTKLLISKSKVAPLKTISIHRLELCGALLLTKLLELTRKAVKMKINEIFCWTDSTIVLSWLSAEPNRWKTFVANRVTKIQEKFPSQHWHYVPGESNPADIASRGAYPSSPKQNQLWWNGPKYLLARNVSTEIIPLVEDQETLIEKRINESVLCTTANETHAMNSDGVDLVHKFSNLTKLKRVTAYCLRFIRNTRLPKNEREIGYLSAQELNVALLFWIQRAQLETFESEISCLKRKVSLSCKSKILTLNPFLDKDNILRVGGRLRHANLPAEQRYPILLAKHHVLTELIVSQYHLKHLHAGAQWMQSLIHQNFWIISCRDVVRRHVRKCVICMKNRAQITTQMMGDLPSARLIPTRPFLKTGVDYTGPFTLRASRGRGQKTFKGYIAVFVCFTTRAIHLELVSDLTTEAFLAALKRFIARRGKCSDLFSDCGTNFRGANRILREIYRSHNQESISRYLSNEGIKWHFNPAASPHMGGLWEAGVKSIKYHLRRIMSNIIFTFEEFYTILVQIEACLNSRPLSPLSTDPNDFSALTPGHFLVGGPLSAIPETDFTTRNTSYLNRWQMTQKVVQHFWKRWRGEYLSRLQTRPKWMSERKNLNLGDLVLLKEENKPPLAVDHG